MEIDIAGARQRFIKVVPIWQNITDYKSGYSSASFIQAILIYVVWASLISIILTGCDPMRPENPPSLSTPTTILPSQAIDPIVQYEQLLTYALEHKIFDYVDNHRGRMAWNTAYFLDSLLNMFVQTGNTRYLDVFVLYADAMLMTRDDIVGRVDFAGRVRPGWQTDSYYTLGKPYVLSDAAGQPSLRVQAIHTNGNNHTRIRVLLEDEQHFTLEVSNNFRRSTPRVVRYEGLTMDTVEARINATLSPQDLIRVWRVGDQPPTEGDYSLSETYVVVLHGLHTPAINIPLARFAALIRERQLIKYQRSAEVYLQRAQESYQDYIDLWREDEEGGYFVFAPDALIWSAGLPVPYNGLALHGRFLLWLYRATGNLEYRQKTEALLSKIRTGMTITPEGTLEMSYWYGQPFHGWDTLQDGPTHGLYAQGIPRGASEDVSHFSLTLQFLLDALAQGLLPDDGWAQAAAQTYVTTIWKPNCRSDNRAAFLAHSLDGQGCMAGYPAGVYARLAPFDARAFSISLDIYQEAYTNPETIDPDYEYGYVLLGWSLLAMSAEQQINR